MLLLLTATSAFAGTTVTDDQVLGVVAQVDRESDAPVAVALVGTAASRAWERLAREYTYATWPSQAIAPAGNRESELALAHKSTGADCLVVLDQAGVGSWNWSTHGACGTATRAPIAPTFLTPGMRPAIPPESPPVTTTVEEVAPTPTPLAPRPSPVAETPTEVEALVSLPDNRARIRHLEQAITNTEDADRVARLANGRAVLERLEADKRTDRSIVRLFLTAAMSDDADLRARALAGASKSGDPPVAVVQAEPPAPCPNAAPCPPQPPCPTRSSRNDGVTEMQEGVGRFGIMYGLGTFSTKATAEESGATLTQTQSTTGLGTAVNGFSFGFASSESAEIGLHLVSLGTTRSTVSLEYGGEHDEAVATGSFFSALPYVAWNMPASDGGVFSPALAVGYASSRTEADYDTTTTRGPIYGVTAAYRQFVTPGVSIDLDAGWLESSQRVKYSSGDSSDEYDGKSRTLYLSTGVSFYFDRPR